MASATNKYIIHASYNYSIKMMFCCCDYKIILTRLEIREALLVFLLKKWQNHGNIKIKRNSITRLIT